MSSRNALQVPQCVGTFKVGAGLQTQLVQQTLYQMSHFRSPYIIYCFETGSHPLVQADYNLMILLSWPPQGLELQVCVTMLSGKGNF